MDDVYKFYDNNASAKVQIKQYFENYQKVIGDYIVPTAKDKDNLMPMMEVQLDEEELSMLIHYYRFSIVCKF